MLHRLSSAFLGIAALAANAQCVDLSWRPIDPAPPPRVAPGLVSDPAGDRLIMFGGLYWVQATHVPGNDTWSWNGQLRSWSRRFPSIRPSPRDSHAMAFDPIRGRAVLFGGATSSGSLLGDTWEFEPDSGQWVQKFPAQSPLPRQGAAMFFDPVSSRVLLFSGSGQAIPSDLWEWTGVTWVERPQTNPPSTRSFTPIAPESVPGRFLLFGGLSANGSSLDDTWRYDSSTNEWLPLAPVTHPAARMSHALVTDPVSRRIVLFGGSSTLGDTWEWDIDTQIWILRSPSQAPLARRYTAGAFDVLRGRAVLYGGYRSSAPLGDLWEWDTGKGQWTPGFVPSGPSPSLSTSMTYDPVRRLIVMLDGANPGVVWEWDGSRWHSVTPAAAVPATASLAFDGTTVIAVFTPSGQTDVQTWRWLGHEWLRVVDCPTQNVGSLRVTFDTFRSRVVMFLGASRETWEWDGGLWQLRFSGGPSTRTAFGMTFDSWRGLTILHGGEGSQTPSGVALLHDTWTWDGMQWLFAASADPARDFSIAFDPSRGKAVIVDAIGTYEWDGLGTWVALPAEHSIRRRSGSLCYHAAANQLMLFGGSALNPSTIDDLDRNTFSRGCSCYANCDQSTTTPRLTANDFQCFLDRFASSDPYANCDGSAAPPILTANDFQCFLNKYAAGCP